MDTSTHPNSKTVTIFRSGSYLSRAQGKDAQEFMAMGKVSVGSYFEKDSQKIASGLSFKEEELLLPSIIDVTKEDRDFRKRVREFYSDIDTRVPAEVGCILEIGLEENNAKEVSKDNMPLNTMDYIRYRHVKGHPWMAASKEEADSNPNKQYYIFDKSLVQEKNRNKSNAKDTALEIYLQLKNEPKKVDMMLTLLLEDPRKYTGKHASDDKIDKLKEFSEKDPENFSKVFKEGEMEIRYTIQSLVNTKIIKQIGIKYVDRDGKIIGNSLEETIFWFKDEDNSDAVVMLKAEMQEALLQPVKPEPRKTQKLAV